MGGEGEGRGEGGGEEEGEGREGERNHDLLRTSHSLARILIFLTIRPSSCPTHLYPSMAAEVEVKLCWVSDAHIHCGTSRNVSTLANLVLGRWDQGWCEYSLLFISPSSLITHYHMLPTHGNHVPFSATPPPSTHPSPLYSHSNL